MGQCSANSSQSRHETSIPLSRKRAINLLYKTHNLLFTQDNNAHSQNRYVHLAEYTTSRNTLVLLTTTSGQLSSTPENDLSFTSWNTDGRCSTPTVHLPVKKSRPSSQKSFQHHISIRKRNDVINSALGKHLRLTRKTRN